MDVAGLQVVPNICRAASGSLWASSTITAQLSGRIGLLPVFRWMASASNRLWLQIWKGKRPVSQVSRKVRYRQVSRWQSQTWGTQMRSRSYALRWTASSASSHSFRESRASAAVERKKMRGQPCDCPRFFENLKGFGFPVPPSQTLKQEKNPFHFLSYFSRKIPWQSTLIGKVPCQGANCLGFSLWRNKEVSDASNVFSHLKG